MSKAVLVNAGGWGTLSAENHDYDDFVGILERRFQDKGVEVAVAKSQEEVEGEVPSAEYVVYLTRGMVNEAVSIKARFPATQVFLLTGLIPEECQPTGREGIHVLAGVTVVNKALGLSEFSKMIA